LVKMKPVTSLFYIFDTKAGITTSYSVSSARAKNVQRAPLPIRP
jgi:hypothetical protein